MCLETLAKKFSGEEVAPVMKEEKVQNLFEDTLDDKKEIPNLEVLEEKIEEVQEVIQESDLVCPEQLKRLQDMMDAASKDFIEENEQIDKETKKAFESMEQQVKNNQVYELILSVRNDILGMKQQDLKIDNALLRRIEDTLETSKSINGKLNKSLAIFFAIVFLVGVITGTQVEVWSPYTSQLLDFLKTTSNITK